jgi:hypothetical protein
MRAFESTEITMFSGFVSRISLRSFGSSTGPSRHHRHRDQEDDQQHQHDVDERRRVDRGDRLFFVAVRATDVIAMVSPTLAGTVRPPWPASPRDSSTACRSAPKPRTRSIAALLRRISQL